MSGCWMVTDPIIGTQIAPGLETVGRGNVPVAQFRGLVVVEPEVDSQWNLGISHCPGKVQIDRSVVNRIPAQDQQALDYPTMQITGQLRQRLELDGRSLTARGVKLDRFVEITQGMIDEVHQNVNIRRLPLAGNHQASSAMFPEIADQRRDPVIVSGDPSRLDARSALDFSAVHSCAQRVISRAGTAMRWSAMAPVSEGVHSAT